MKENGVFNKIKNLISEVVFSQDENQILEENYATGIEYFNEWFKDFTNLDNYEKAEVYFLKALEVNSENYDVYPSLAMLYQSRWYRDYSKMEFYEKAESNYEKTRMCGIVNPILLCNFAVLYLARWENCGYEEIYFDKTESLLLKSIELVEYYDRPVKTLGDMYKNKWLLDTSKTEYFDKAETYLEKAYEMEESEYNGAKDATLCFNLGYIYQTKWNFSECSDKELAEKAEKLYLKSIELDPKAYVAMSNLGVIYENRWLQDKTNMENAEKAIEWYKKSFEDDEAFPYGKRHLAKLYTLIWEYTGADYEFLKESEKLYLDIIDNSDDVGLVFNFAVLNSVLWENDTSQMEYFDKAESLYIQVINLDNNYIGAVKNLERLNRIKLIVDSDSTSETEYSDRLIELATEVIESEDFALEFINQLGNSLKEIWRQDRSKIKYYELSEKLLNKALKLGDGYESLDLLKDLYLTKWNENHDEIYFETIEKLYTDRLALNNNDVVVLQGLGLVYEHRWLQNKDDMQFFDKAKECYEKCLEIDKQHQACNYLGFLYGKRWEQTNEEKYFEKAEKYYLNACGEAELFSQMYLSDLYAEKWRNDKTSLEYFEKSIECSERIAENADYHTAAIVRISELYEQLLENNWANVEYFDKAVNYLEPLFKANDYIGKLAGRIGYMYHERYRQDKREDYETALNWYLTAFKLDNSLFWVASNIGRVYYSMSRVEKNQKTSKEQYELSKNWYETAVETDTNHSSIYAPLSLGRILGSEWKNETFNDELFRKTEYLYKRVLEIDPNNKSASWNLANLYRDKWVLDKTKNEYFEMSVEFYECMVENHPKDADFANNLGDLYMLRWEFDKENNVEDLEKAKALFYRTIELDNEYYYAYENLGIIYFNFWENDKTNDEYRELSKQNYEKAYELDVENIFISKDLTIIKFYEYENISKDLETLEDASKYFEYSLREKSYYNVENRDLVNKEYLDLAEKFFTNALKDYDNNVGCLTALGDVYAAGYANNPKSTKLFSKAEKYYTKSLKLKEDPEVMAKLSLLYVRQYKADNFFLLPTANYAYLTKARRYYEKVMKLQPDNIAFKRKFDNLLETK